MKNNNKKFGKTNKTAKKYLPLMASLVPLTLFPVDAQAQLAIILSGTVDLNFGSISAGAAGGTVTMPVAGPRSKTGAVELIAGAGLESAAMLSISGSTGVLIDVNMTNTVFTVDDAGAGAPMNVNAFDINGGGPTVSLTLTTNPSVFPIGATLTIGAGQLAGVYSGSYTVMADYQ